MKPRKPRNRRLPEGRRNRQLKRAIGRIDITKCGAPAGHSLYDFLLGEVEASKIVDVALKQGISEHRCELLGELELQALYSETVNDYSGPPVAKVSEPQDPNKFEPKTIQGPSLST